MLRTSMNSLNTRINVSIFSLTRLFWTKNTCSCSFLDKNYNCYHVLGVCVNESFEDVTAEDDV